LFFQTVTEKFSTETLKNIQFDEDKTVPWKTYLNNTEAKFKMSAKSMIKIKVI